MSEEIKPKTVPEMKAEAIRLIANSKCFIIITDDGSLTDRRMVLDNAMTAVSFIREMEILKQGILFAKPTPPPSNIVKS